MVGFMLSKKCRNTFMVNRNNLYFEDYGFLFSKKESLLLPMFKLDQFGD